MYTYWLLPSPCPTALELWLKKLHQLRIVGQRVQPWDSVEGPVAFESSKKKKERMSMAEPYQGLLSFKLLELIESLPERGPNY